STAILSFDAATMASSSPAPSPSSSTSFFGNRTARLLPHFDTCIRPLMISLLDGISYDGYHPVSRRRLRLPASLPAQRGALHRQPGEQRARWLVAWVLRQEPALEG